MNGQSFQVVWLLVLTVMGLVNVIVFLVKAKKNNPGNHGERIATLEAKVANIEKDIEEIKRKLEKK